MCDKVYCECCREAFAAGFVRGAKWGLAEGYSSGYADAMLGIAPPRVLRPAIAAKLIERIVELEPPPVLKLERLDAYLPPVFPPVGSLCRKCGLIICACHERNY